jgi:hypothetical protein
MSSRSRQQLFAKKPYRDPGYLIAPHRPEVPRAHQNVRLRSFLRRGMLLYQGLTTGIFAPESN